MYRITQTSIQDEKIRAYSSLLQSVFPKAAYRLSPSYINWLYKENPLGSVIGFDAFFEEALVAHYVTIPVEYWIEGVKKKGVLSLNTATSPAHQGKGLFKMLAEKTYERAAELGYEFVVGVANRNSTHGLTKKLGFDLVSPLDARISYGFHGDTELLPGITCAFRSEISEVWLNWRLSNPSQDYKLKRNLIVSDTTIVGLTSVLTSTQALKAPQALSLSRLKNSYSPFNLWIGLNSFVLSRFMSFNIPMRLRPSPLNLIFKSLKSTNVHFDKREIRFDLIDFDAY